MLSHFLKNRVYAGVTIGLLITVLCAIGLSLGLFSNLNAGFIDSLYTRSEPSDEIVIIGVDDKSTQPPPEGLGRFNEWSRENFTKLLQVLEAENPKVVTLDFVFHTSSDGVKRQQLLELEEKIDNDSSDSAKLGTYNEFLKNYRSNLNHPIDNEFAAELARFPNLVLDAVINPNDGSLIKPLTKFLTTATLGIASANMDERGVMIDNIPTRNISGENYDDLGLATAKKYLGKAQINLPTQNEKILINYFGEPHSFQIISFVDVLNGEFPAGTFKNKIVLIGTTSSKVMHDEYLTPRSNVTPMPGIEIIANEIQTILEEKYLVNQGTVSALLTIAAISIGLAIGLNYLGVWASLSVIFAGILLYIFAAHLSYKNGLLVNMLYPPAAILLTYLASWIYKYFITDKRGRELKSAFGHYVSGELVEQISRNPDLVKLGGEKKMVTVFFSDIKDSTAHSEKTPIEMWVSQVNEYFTVMGNVLKRSGGTLDKYEGDAVMGFWNAPVSQTDHVFRAYACAIGMRKALTGLHEKWAKEGKPLIEFRIGINTGEALVGNFGSADQFNFTVMGDTVNTASRLESAANKAYGTTTIVAGFENTLTNANQTSFPGTNADSNSQSAGADLSPGLLRSACSDRSIGEHRRTTSQSQPTSSSQHKPLANFTIRELDTVYLPGKKEPVIIFELLGLSSEATDETRSLLKAYSEGLAAYRKKDFAAAVASFSSIQKTLPTFATDTPTQILLTRCQKLQAGEKIPELDEQMIFRIQNK